MCKCGGGVHDEERDEVNGTPEDLQVLLLILEKEEASEYRQEHSKAMGNCIRDLYSMHIQCEVAVMIHAYSSTIHT